MRWPRSTAFISSRRRETAWYWSICMPRMSACLYEQLKKALEAGQVTAQPLLVPETLSVSESEADAAEDYAEEFASLGFEIDRQGLENVRIRQVPALLRDRGTGALVRDVLADLAEAGSSSRVKTAVNEMLGDPRVPRGNPGQPPADGSRDECAAAPDGADGARRSMQPRPANLDAS